MQYSKTIIFPILLTLNLFLASTVLDKFELNYAWFRVLSLAILWSTTIFLRFQKKVISPSFNSKKNLTLFSITILILLGLTIIPKSLLDIPHGPRCDIGWTTKDAVHTFIANHQNPYESKWIGKIGDDSRFWGYHYGPGTIVAYLPSEFLGEPGLKIFNLIYLIVTFLISFLLVYYNEIPSERKTALIFLAMLLCLPTRLWYETFLQGATDILPIGLILASVLFIQKKNLFIAGILAGFSISCKLIPGCLFLILLIRLPINWKLIYGIIWGLLPMVMGAVWNSETFFNNLFLFHQIKTPDSTSLYSELPSTITNYFPLLQLLILISFFIKNIKKTFDPIYLISDLLLILILIEITYREIHGNHLIWIFPLVGILFTQGRYGGFQK